MYSTTSVAAAVDVAFVAICGYFVQRKNSSSSYNVLIDIACAILILATIANIFAASSDVSNDC